MQQNSSTIEHHDVIANSKGGVQIVTHDNRCRSLSQIMGAYKTTSSKLIHEADFDMFAWHRSFHDHIIRDEKSYQNIVNYIENNPNSWSKDKFYKK